MDKNKKILLITIISIFVFIIVILVLHTFFVNGPTEGKLLYKVDNWSGDIWGGHLDFMGNTIAWIQDEGDVKENSEFLYILDISDENNPSLITKEKIETYGPTGPFVFNEGVLWEDNNLWYFYNISKNQKNIIDLAVGIGIKRHLLLKSSNYIYFYNLYNGSQQLIDANPLCTSFSDDFIIWGEQSDLSEWDSKTKFPYEIWIYNISSGQKNKIISNLSYSKNPGLSIAVYGTTIVYSDDISIYTYDILTGKNKMISDHSRKNVKNAKEKYFSNIRIYEENLIYVEISNEITGIDNFEQVVKYWVVNISSNEKLELETAYCIDKEKVVGITVTWGVNDELYIYNLYNLYN